MTNGNQSAAPGGFLGTVVGRQIVNRMPEARFRTAFRILLTVLALRLLYEGLIG
mgnify:FL=1